MATEYVVLKHDGILWKEVGQAMGASNKGALRNHLNGKSDTDGQYIAIPSRSWQILNVKVERTVKIGS